MSDDGTGRGEITGAEIATRLRYVRGEVAKTTAAPKGPRSVIVVAAAVAAIALSFLLGSAGDGASHRSRDPSGLMLS